MASIKHKNADSIKKWSNIVGIIGSALAIATPIIPAAAIVYVTVGTGIINLVMKQLADEPEEGQKNE